jgi:hypothetical protein
MVDYLSSYFGARKKRSAPKRRRRSKGSKRRSKKSPGRKPKRGHGVRKLLKSKAYIRVGGRKRKLYRGKNGAIYYRTKSGKNYVPASVLRRKGHVLSPKRKRRSSKKRTRRSKKKKLKKSKAAVAARRYYRKNRARILRKARARR